MALDLNKLDKQVTDALDQMTDEDWKEFKQMMTQRSFKSAEIITKKIEVSYYKHGDFEWELLDLREVLENVDDGNTRVYEGKLLDYFLENKIVTPYLRHHNPDVNFKSFQNTVFKLMYPEE